MGLIVVWFNGCILVGMVGLRGDVWISWVLGLVVVVVVGMVEVCGVGIIYRYLLRIVIWFLIFVGDCLVGFLVFGIIVDMGEIIVFWVVCLLIFCNDFKGL